MRLSSEAERLLRRRMERLSPLGARFHFFVRDGRLFHARTGVELSDDAVRLLLRTIKMAVRRKAGPAMALDYTADGRAYAASGDVAAFTDGRLVIGPEVRGAVEELSLRERPTNTH